MSKKSRRNSRRPSAISSTYKTIATRPRVHRPIASQSVTYYYSLPAPAPRIYRRLAWSDGRRWAPPGFVMPISTVRSSARHVIKQRPNLPQPSQTKGVIAFAEPQKVDPCKRRSTRRAIIFAKGVGGSSPRKFRKRRRSRYSEFNCS